jgi:hypothetical protein
MQEVRTDMIRATTSASSDAFSGAFSGNLTGSRLLGLVSWLRCAS